jgi:hypothetical protein
MCDEVRKHGENLIYMIVGMVRAATFTERQGSVWCSKSALDCIVA